MLCVCVQAAGNAVKRASDNLVKAAQKAAFDAQDDQAVVVKSKMVGGIAQVSHRGRKKLCSLHNTRQVRFTSCLEYKHKNLQLCS